MTEIHYPPATDIWVVFSGQTDWRWLRALKPGYRHCFAIIKGPTHWLMLDSLLHRMDITITQLEADFDLPAWMESRGYTVVAAPRRTVPVRVAPMMPFTCVEAMKRLVGIRGWHILTPWQLYKALTKPQRAAPERTGSLVPAFMGGAYGQTIRTA